jgi:acyl transferase domain-containing protein
VDELATAALIAVSSYTARWPGSVAEELRGIIDASGDAVTSSVPQQRWDVGSSFGHLNGAQNDSVRHGGFLSGVERFDNVCFAIATAEATVMDPQQRLLLEVGYASLAGAHLRRAALMHSSLGVYLGLMNLDSFQLTSIASKSAFAATCRSSSIAAGRLSFTLGLNGACQSVDTACSSALVAMRAASAGMVLGDHGGALCASVSLILSPVASVYYAQATMLSADGRCKTLDARANGYSRAESLCAVFLTLGHEESRVAVVKLGGSMVRQDGRSASLTAPNGSAQLVLIRQAMDRASTMPAQVDRQMKPCPW